MTVDHRLQGLGRDDLIGIIEEQAAEIARLRALWTLNGLGEDTDVRTLIANHRAWTQRAEENATFQREVAASYAGHVRQLQSALDHLSAVIHLVAQQGATVPEWPVEDPDPVVASVESARTSVVESIRVLDVLLGRIEGLEFSRPAGGEPGGVG